MSIILLATHIAGAQTVGVDTLSQYRTLHLDSVQVTARRSAATVVRIVVPQTRFLVDQKEVAPLGSAEAVLRLLPEIDLRERAGKSPQADIAIRGGSFDQTMVMLNGIDFSDARTGHQSHSLPVDLDVISDIAVIDVTTHPGALSGAVDFQTRPFAPQFVRLRLEGGAWGYAYGNLSGAWTGQGTQLGRKAYAGDRLTVLGAASYRRSDGYRHNTDFWNLNLYSRVTYNSAKAGVFDLQGGFQRRDWGSNGFYSLAYPDQFESTLTGLASAKWTKRWGGTTLSATGSFRRNNDLFAMVRADLPSANYHTTYNAFGELYANHDWTRAGTTTLGVNYTRHRIFSTALGEDIPNPSHKIPRLGGLYPKGKVRGTTAVWAGHYKSWNRAWVHGIASVVDTPYGTDGTFGATAGWRIDRTFTLIGTASRSSRLPTFTDLYYNVAIYHPDPNLKPETAMAYRLTAEAAGFVGRRGSGRWKATASVWYRRTKDVIDWEQRPDPDDPDRPGDWWSTQLNRLGSVGAELSAYCSTDGWLRVAMLNYGYVHSDMTVRAGYISKYALDYMRHKVSALVGVGFLRDFTLTLTGSFYDRMGSYIAADGAVEGYRPYFLLDGRMSWEKGVVQLYLDVTNITGTRYFDFGGLPMPGCGASAGIVVTIK